MPVTKTKFAGFPDDALRFYEGLEVDNTKAYWTDHKAIYDDAVKGPAEALLTELGPEFGEGKIFRPYRDVRFSGDKTPYKTHLGGYIRRETGVGYYLQLSADGLYAAGGMYEMASDQVERLRHAIDDDKTGIEIEAAVSALRAKGFSIGGAALKTVPRGFDKEHSRAELLKHKGLYAGRTFEPAAWLHTARAKTKVVETWRALAPLIAWVETNVGPSRLPAERRR
jgi:uncharacterized protein (TIGR02453 family)